MILILSKSKIEKTTDDVMDWLDKFNGNYFRLNGGDFLKEATIKNGAIQYENFDSEAVSVVWNRRWSSNELINNENEAHYEALGVKNATTLLRSLRGENAILRSFLFSKLAGKVWTTRPGKMSANKISNLEVAKSCNLAVPEYIITSEKSTLIQFAKKHKRIICKPISETPFFSSKVEANAIESLILYTKSFSVKQIEEQIEDSFFQSLFQQEIIKAYEIRVFYFNETCYAMAIFSQNDAQTQTDFRNYNKERPNRTVPLLLPEELEKNIVKFCKKAGYTIGSLDLIKSTDGTYYFLEINPVGQFGMVSYPCNYYLEKKLANYLIDEDKKIS